jgi:hypothetical protein
MPATVVMPTSAKAHRAFGMAVAAVGPLLHCGFALAAACVGPEALWLGH